MLTPGELTGALVRELRERHKLSRQDLYAMCGFTGKSTARLMNIETKDSWKPGDREVLAAVLSRFTDVSDQSPEPTATGLIDATACDDLDDEEADLVTVGPEPRAVVLDEPDPDEVPADLAIPGPPVQRSVRLLPVVTNGQLQTFKRCRRKWWLAWYRRLALASESRTDARATGTRVHRALEAWYVPEGQPRVDPRDALERVIVEDHTKIVARARQLGHDEFVITNLLDDFKRVADLERAMIEGYVDWLSETGADAELRIIAPEHVVTVDVSVPRLTGTITPVTLMGLLDVQAERTTDGVKLFLDHKTVQDFTNPTRALHQNEQMLHYHLIQWLALAGTDTRCDGALYNMLRKVKRTARATPPFYQRVEVRHNDFELESYKEHVLATTDQLLTATALLDEGVNHQRVAYPTRTRDCGFDCDFFAVCSMFDDGSRAEDALASLYTSVEPLDRYEPKPLNTLTTTQEGSM